MHGDLTGSGYEQLWQNLSIVSMLFRKFAFQVTRTRIANCLLPQFRMKSFSWCFSISISISISDKQYTLLIRAINLLQQDTVLKWNQNGDREEAIVPKEATIEKPITYTDVQSPIDFRSFVKGTRIPTSVNRRRSYVYNHQESPENRVIEVEIDLGK